MGGAGASKAAGDPLPDATLKLCQEADAILFGALPAFPMTSNCRLVERPGASLLQAAQGA